MKKIQLSDHFTYGKLLRFTLPSIVMMIFTSIYGVVDGIFVSNFAGKVPFAAINLIMSYIMTIYLLVSSVYKMKKEDNQPTKVVEQAKDYGIPEKCIMDIFNTIHEASVEVQNEVISGKTEE